MGQFHFSFNTSTIRGQKLSLVEEIDIAAQAGYQAIEPWIKELETYVQQGGSLPDLKKHIADSGLTVESAIGFAEWIVDDEDRRTKGLEQARRDMELVQQIGGKRIAAPAAGATDLAIEYSKVIDRYRALLTLGDHFDVVPQVEVWGFSKTLTRLGQAALVAIDSDHPRACVLPDVYHLYKGGSNFNGLKLLGPAAVHVMHVNDYPANPPRAAIKDSDRVYPGDGVAPLKEVFRTLREIGFDGYLSVELFNPTYWQQDPLLVARTALDKLKSLIQQS
ncbi:MAG TPA: sugar phosphate isomerase/epimerase family protein [Lacipirellulaceae bacterium]|jgi:sugar phosphate isomerase/epimerase|nr:sugar phosphate isomerase/epimerase family protein [Lacipirellulaceae bacterium]